MWSDAVPATLGSLLSAKPPAVHGSFVNYIEQNKTKNQIEYSKWASLQESKVEVEARALCSGQDEVFLATSSG